MEYKYLKELQKNIFSFKDVKPSSNEKIMQLETELNIKLPTSVKEFFLLTGDDYDMMLRGGGGAKQGLNNIEYIQSVAFDLLKSTEVELSNIFPFLEYGDQFLFVYLNEGENPVVYRFETELFYCGDDYIPESSSWGYPKGVSKVADSFSEMINQVIENKIKPKFN